MNGREDRDCHAKTQNMAETIARFRKTKANREVTDDRAALVLISV
jgi:hypothetical protein